MTLVHIENALDTFMRVMTVDVSTPSTERILAELDEGERQAVALAFGLGKNVLLLMDDYAGRQAAKSLQIHVTGLVGLLVLAKQRGLVEKVGSLVEELRNAGYWLSDEIAEIARKLAEE